MESRETISRRGFVAASAVGMAGALVNPSSLVTAAAATPRRRAEITTGITVDTRPDWNGAENFIRSIDEASEIGYRSIETFRPYVERWFDNPQGLKDELDRRGLTLETVSGGGNFVDPAQAAETIEYNMEIVRFMSNFDVDHLKINIGGTRQTESQVQSPEVYRQMASTFNELGRRISDMGQRFGIHAHGSHGNYGVFGSRADIDAIMELTDPEHVYLILDTGWITMAGMDPVQLTRDYTDRIIEFHFKDVSPENRGGAPLPQPGATREYDFEAEYPGVDPDDYPASILYRNRQFFELGRGGVDFPGILQVLHDAAWKGWITIELDSTITTSKGSATVNKEYLETILGLDVEAPTVRPSWNT